MITTKDVIEYVLPEEDYKRVQSNAKLAAIGGVSRIRDKDSRRKNLHEDQLVGQISTYAGSVVLTGSAEGYYQARDIANANPYEGDGGVDIIGLDNIDIKGSLMRASSDPLDYRLLVRPKERHDQWIYILAMVPKSRPYKTYLVGWAYDKDLPDKPNKSGIFEGAFVIRGGNLRKMEQLLSLKNE